MKKFICDLVGDDMVYEKNRYPEQIHLDLFMNKTEIVFSCSNLTPLNSDYHAVVKVPLFFPKYIQVLCLLDSIYISFNFLYNFLLFKLMFENRK